MAVKALIPAVEDLSETLLDARLRWKRLAERKARMVESGGLARDIERDVQIVEEYIREGRFQRSLSLIAGISALLGGLEVTYEHYQGSYSQRIMYSPLVASAGVAVAACWGVFDRRVARTALPIASLVLLGDGVTGFIFHIRGVARKPGGWSLPVTNVTMGPPLFAPLLLGTGGFLGLIASLLRREDDPLPSGLPGLWEAATAWFDKPPDEFSAHRRSGSAQAEWSRIRRRIREGRFQRILAGATAVSALLNGMEALYSHYKNNYRYRVQWLPILLSPVIAAAGLGAIWNRTIAETLLPATSLAAAISGLVGLYYHLRGTLRRPGGLKLPVYNIIYGPPAFAPLLYSSTGFLGLLASLLRRGD
jgi:hypothetical protein